MFDKILLTLDGSELAESAMPYVRDLAGQLESDVYLLHVCPAEHQAYRHMHQIYLQNMAQSLIEQIRASRSANPEPQVFSEVVVGEPVKVISDYVKQKDINLIAMTTAGTSGFRQWAMGSVAEKVIRSVSIPSLLIRVKETNPPPTRGLIHKILLPVDTSDGSQAAIAYAVELAKKMKASIALFSMAPTVYAQHLDSVGGGVGINWGSIDSSTEKLTEEYLQKIENEIRDQGIEVSHSSYLGVDAANEILEMEKRVQADLVVMATRGRSGVVRWAFGSVAEKVLRAGDRPLLLIRGTGSML